MKSSIFLFLMVFSISANAGVFIENGGDSVYCSAEGKFLSDWMYVLDFAVDFPSDLNHLYKATQLEGYLDRFEDLFSKNTPELLSSFRDFRRSIPTKETLLVGSSFGVRQWTPSRQPLRNVQDEKVKILPRNCREASKGIFIQTVVREQQGDRIQYFYDIDVMSEYIKFDPMQASALLMHEWLWDFFDSAIPLRKLNAFLHSTNADSASKESFRSQMKIPLGKLVTVSSAATLVQIPMRWVPELNPDLVLANGFTPHHGFQGTGFRIEPIHRHLSPIDYVAWHDESWDDLTTLFGKAWGWPRQMTEAQNANDLENLHYKRFLTQEMISYEILSPEGERAYGSLYVVPGKCGNYGAVAAYWVTTPMRAQIEATVYAELKQWLDTMFPWQPIYFPGGPNMSDRDRANRYQMMNHGICREI